MSSTWLVTSFSSTLYKAKKRIWWCLSQLRMNQFALTWFYLKTNEQKKEPIKLTLFTEKIKFIFWTCIKWKLQKHFKLHKSSTSIWKRQEIYTKLSKLFARQYVTVANMWQGFQSIIEWVLCSRRYFQLLSTKRGNCRNNVENICDEFLSKILIQWPEEIRDSKG